MRTTPSEPTGEVGAIEDAGSVYDVAVLQKALDLLEIVSEGSDLGLAELSARTGASKASSFRILSTLHRRGYMTKDPAVSYTHLTLPTKRIV